MEEHVISGKPVMPDRFNDNDHDAQMNWFEEIINVHGVDILNQPEQLQRLISDANTEKRYKHILTIMLENHYIDQILRSIFLDQDNQEINAEIIIRKLRDDYGFDRHYLQKIVISVQHILRKKVLFARGRSICNQLKDMRREFAKANEIDFEEEDCNSTEPCDGTCPYCDAKMRELIRKSELAGMNRNIVFPQKFLRLTDEQDNQSRTT